jgi:hypothetical protein
VGFERIITKTNAKEAKRGANEKNYCEDWKRKRAEEAVSDVRADNLSSLSVSPSDTSSVTQLLTPSSQESFGFPGPNGNPEASTHPATESSNAVKLRASEATVLPDDNRAVTPDVRAANELGFEYISLHSRTRLKLTSFSFGNNILEVLVGRETFAIHKTVAKNRMPNLLIFMETGLDFTPYFPIEPDEFNMYVHHAYTRQLPSKPSSSSPTAEDHALEITLLCKFFAVAVLMNDEVAMKDALNGFKAKAHEQSVGSHPLLLNKENITVIYEHTKQFSGARRLMVDMHVKKKDVGACAWVKDHAAEDPPYPDEFLADLAVALLEQREERMKIP